MEAIVREKATAVYTDLLQQIPDTSVDEASEDSFKASLGWLNNSEKGLTFTPHLKTHNKQILG